MSSPQIPTLPEAMENTLTLPVNESNGTTSCLRIVVLDPLALSRQDVHHWQPILDWLGQESATAQRIAQPMTSGQKLLLHARTEDAHHAAPADKIYLAVGDKEEPNVIKGFLRVGRKHLFLEKETGFREHEPLCLLDFFVFSSFQRQGIGKCVFDAMLKNEGVLPEQMAFDRPSNASLSFLSRYYGLCRPEFKANRFMVDTFFWSSAAT